MSDLLFWCSFMNEALYCTFRTKLEPEKRLQACHNGADDGNSPSHQ